MSKQISELKTQQAELDKIIPNLNREKIIKGSLIETNQGLFFIAIALGKINIQNKNILVVSPSSPVANNLIIGGGKNFSFNNQEYKIKFIS